MSLLDYIGSDKAWHEFLEYKTNKNYLNKRELAKLQNFVDNKEYYAIASKIKSKDYTFSPPRKSMVNKVNSHKKRVVYTFAYEENYVLKLMSWLLYKYDSYHCDNCYSFRQNFGVKKAIGNIICSKNIDSMYGYKLDISDYFNSVNINLLLPILKNMMNDDIELYLFFEKLLSDDKSVFDDELINEKRGIMAGTPISPFLANIYLREMDEYFFKKGIIYARYSDDIILFTKGEKYRDENRNVIMDFLDRYNLKINPKKELFINPYQKWEFLGISYKSKLVDISDITLEKMKGKIRRKANALYRWKLKKNTTDERAMRAMIKTFNKKFYDNQNISSDNLTWSRWFFPVINVDNGLKVIDNYLQQYIRFIASGKHTKKNFKIDYCKLKEMGYRSLVNEYYRYKKSKRFEHAENTNMSMKKR